MEQHQIDTGSDGGLDLLEPANVILFNDKHHSMDEVAVILVRALGCGLEDAMKMMLEAHNTGRACIFSGDREHAKAICKLLDAFQLGNKLE